MADTLGIANISGTSIANLENRSGTSKANIWDINGEQRQSSLFRTLSDAGWATYTAGKNAASFTATSALGVVGISMFPYADNDGRKTYNFSFNKNVGTNRDEWVIAASLSSTFNPPFLATTSIDGSGNITASISVTNRTQSIYLGILSSNRNTQTASISNLIVTAS